MLGQIAYEEIERLRETLTSASRQVWENPEIYGHEYFAAKLYTQILEEQGFEVELGIAGINTAFRATWGSGKPVLGFLAEYDALPGMSQKVCTHKDPVVEGANGHGCAHNLIGCGVIGGALGLKKEMIETGKTGTIVVYGCPAEEKLIGKIFMARAGYFKDLDTALYFHPGRYNGPVTLDMLAVNSVNIKFSGKTAHAAMAPEVGRSALDAVELTNVAANYLREHVKPDVRFHYVITNGGDAPNVVPDRASVWYLIRATSRENVDEVYRRLTKIAQGAALMTETDVEIELESACYPTIFNEVISNVLTDSLQEVPHEAWTKEELEFAHALNETTPKEWAEACKKWKAPVGTDLYEGVLPPQHGQMFGSTDMGDVSYITPTTFLYTACVNIAAPVHSWQATACANHSMGFKGAIYAAKTLALTALKLLENPEILQKAKAEFLEKSEGKPYVCPIPDDAPIPIPELKK